MREDWREMINGLLALVVFLPIISAPIIYVLRKRFGKSLDWGPFIILLFITLITAPLVLTAHEQNVLEEYLWTTTPVKLTFGLLGDGLSVPILFTMIFVFAFSVLFSIPYMRRRMQRGDIVESDGKYAVYYTFYLLYAGSVLGAILSTNLIEFYLFFECAVVFSWFLIFIYGYGKREKISLTYFIWTSVGALFLLTGILFAYQYIGSFEIADLWRISESPIGTWIGLAFTLGILVKIGALGLHGWLPSTYGEAPTPVSAVLGATSVVLGTYSLARLLVPFREVMFGISGWLELWALLTILYAGVMALRQSDTKRLVAYLSMSQMNYCFLGVFTYMYHGVLGAVSYSISHGLAIALLFLVAGAIQYRTGTRNMDELGGLAAKLPSSMIAILVGFLTIGGLPPSVGFKSKFILLTGAFERAFMSARALEWIIAILAATVATIITVAYEFRTVWRVFYGKLPRQLQDIREEPLSMIVALLALSSLLILFGIWPMIITKPLDVFFEHLPW
jgi:NADH-quinone oxidoreductase subunit M